MHAVEKANLEELPSFVTLDGSSIRELAGPSWTQVRYDTVMTRG
ncbi:MAG: hypothetical protein WBP81_37065 [Solirubrobacteraceae bacterium]